MEETESIKHLAVFHLTKELWITETVEDKDLTFEVEKTFMLPSKSNSPELWFTTYVFVPTISKMYKGSHKPYVMHHYHLAEGKNLTEELKDVENRFNETVVNKN